MGLKAIRENKIAGIIDALEILEKVELEMGKDNLDSWELKDLKVRLLDKHKRYQEMLLAIEEQINDFERLYRQVRMKVLPSKLKALKTELSSESEQFLRLKTIIQQTYRY
ncbi:hypothetical protein [Pedobacter aquatilis]|uniref:hypothetical protein n=1 Tax=Pedobacter aquatilis TaxID=351343 RepID=UPI002930A79B|nr:hypothetical protein [Pedobacter aquatilis]